VGYFTGYHRSQVKPPGIPRLNWRHPLAQGLVFYGIDVGSGPLELVAGRPGTLGNPTGNKPAVAASPWGTGLLWNGLNSMWFGADGAIEAATTALVYSWACACVTTGTLGSSARPFGRTANNNSSAPDLNWAFRANASGSGQGNIAADVNSSGAQTAITTWTGNAENVFTSLVGVVSSGGAGSLYAQGALIGSNTGLTIQHADTNSSVLFAGGSSTSGSAVAWTGFVFYGAFWNRVLTPGEIVALHEQPYDLLEWPCERVPRSNVTGPNVNGDCWAVLKAPAGLSPTG
jgi:Concanavalin A-like lectin/glucanases superfamily